MTKYDVAVIGGGIVGLATAYKFISRCPGKRAIVVEKEPSVCQHQSGHNSGVLHSGIYYKPGSEKALNCRKGINLMKRFAADNGIPHKVSGKVIVATRESELKALQTIFERGTSNGVACRMISKEEVREHEPHVLAVKGIFVEEAGVIDYPAVCKKLQQLIEQSGSVVQCGCQVVRGIESTDGVRIETTKGDVLAQYVISAAGLHADKVLTSFRQRSPCRIVPFRGEYYQVKKERDHLCRALIYPVPNPDFPFLGVHYTRGVHGEVECGPNAVLALAREGYAKLTINPREALESLSFPGLYRFVLRHWRESSFEVARSFSKRLFCNALQRLIPEITLDDLEPGPTAVRAQAMVSDGRLVDDFLWFDTPRGVHVLNAPSPAATSSLSIGETVVERLLSKAPELKAIKGSY